MEIIMCNIAVIITGGTIASTKKENYISLNGDKYKIIELFKEKNPDAAFWISFDTFNPYTILSENLSGKYINTLIKCAREILNDSKKYDGIIITHGTDTLQYSSAALALALSDVKIPVVFVSANYILDDERSNGLINFTQAVEYISSYDMTGVYVSYDGSVLDGFTLLPHMPYSDKIYALNHSDKLSEESSAREFLMYEGITFDNALLTDIAPVLYLKAVPGQTYPSFNDTDIKAILLETYHSGTLGTDSKLFHRFCKAAYDKNIPVYAVGVESRTQYESTASYDQLHLTVMHKISPIAAYMYLWFKYSKK
ncbi:MAG: asparaginase [Lachnospiraceae bacterium]|nr:asparaginase [Lachnospiraceae bacterium]